MSAVFDAGALVPPSEEMVPSGRDSASSRSAASSRLCRPWSWRRCVQVVARRNGVATPPAGPRATTPAAPAKLRDGRAAPHHCPRADHRQVRSGQIVGIHVGRGRRLVARLPGAAGGRLTLLVHVECGVRRTGLALVHACCSSSTLREIAGGFTSHAAVAQPARLPLLPVAAGSTWLARPAPRYDATPDARKEAGCVPRSRWTTICLPRRSA